MSCAMGKKDFAYLRNINRFVWTIGNDLIKCVYLDSLCIDVESGLWLDCVYVVFTQIGK